MSSCINNGRGNGGTGQAGDTPQVVERYFNNDGKLLAAHYPEVYNQIAEAVKRHKKKSSFLDQGAAIEKRVSDAKVNGWTIGACYNRCSTDMQDSYMGQISRCIDRAIQKDIDPRSTSGVMRPEAFRKLLVNERVTGKWCFGKLRNTWKDSKNSTVQEAAPEHEVITVVREELRIVSDELFYAVRKKLDEGTRGRHGSRMAKESPLSTSLISLFRCSECGRTFYHYGRQYMHCPETRRGGCKNWGTVSREAAVRSVIAALRERVLANPELVDAIVRHSRRLDVEESRDDLAKRILAQDNAIAYQNRIMHLIEQNCFDYGMDAKDAARHKAAKVEKSRLQTELAGMKARSAGERRELSDEDVRGVLNDFDTLLADAGANKLGADGKQRTAVLIRSLVGGVIKVSFTRLQGRRAFGVGTFTPNLALVLVGGNNSIGGAITDTQEITVSFRELPRYERIADEVYRLRTEDGLSFTELGKRFNIGSGNAWGAFAYWHTSRGLEVPYTRKCKHNKPAS